MSKVELGGVVALKGQKSHGFASVANTCGQMPIRIPVWIANGSHDGPTFCVVAGIHGVEYSGMEAVRRVMMELDADRLRGKMVTVPCVNTPGLGKNRSCPLDQRNINRLFPGRLDGSISELIAHVVFTEFIAKSDFFADLHDGAGGLFPFATYHTTGRKELDAASRALALSSGIPEIAITERNYDKGQSYAEASERGIPSVLWEAPGAAGFDQTSVDIHLKALLNCLKHLRMIDGTPEVSANPEFLQGFQTLNAREGGFFYPRVNLGQDVEKGQVLGEIVDFFGQKLEEIKSPARGIVLTLRINSVHAVDAGESIGEIGLREAVAEQKPPL